MGILSFQSSFFRQKKQQSLSKRYFCFRFSSFKNSFITMFWLYLYSKNKIFVVSQLTCFTRYQKTFENIHLDGKIHWISTTSLWISTIVFTLFHNNLCALFQDTMNVTTTTLTGAKKLPKPSSICQECRSFSILLVSNWKWPNSFGLYFSCHCDQRMKCYNYW